MWVTCVYREKHLSFDIFCQKAEEKKPHSERGQFQVLRLDKRKYLRPLIISLDNLSPLHISPALCQRASEGFADVWHVSLECEVDAGWIHKTSTKTRQPSPADKIQTVVPKMLVTQFFRYKNKRYTSPPATYRSSTKKTFESTHTQHFAEHTLLLFSFLFCVQAEKYILSSYRYVFLGGLLVQRRRLSLICQTASPWNNKSSNRIVATQ